jgi:glucokinase
VTGVPLRSPGNNEHEDTTMSRQPVLAADIGGTHMRAALIDVNGNILNRRSAPTPSAGEAPAALIDLIASVGADGALGAAPHAVVGLPGGVDYDAGRLLWAPHLPDRWPDLLSRDALSRRLGLDVYVANDADLAAVGEALFGAGAGSNDVAYLTVSTGIGAGIVHDGRLLRGCRSLAEVGHTIIDRLAWLDGRPCTLEELASGSGVARQALEQGLGTVAARDVAQAAEGGDAKAQAVWRDAIASCAVGVANLIMAFSPSTVVIGGGMGRRQDFFIPLRDLVLGRAQRFPDDLAIVPAGLGDDAALAGAAGWVTASGC